MREQLASLRFYDLAADCPTHAGVLLFAKDPLRWIPGAYVQFVRWSGTTMSDEPKADKRFAGDLLTLLRELQGFLSLPGQAYPVPESALRERLEIDYPPVAIRELLWNAVMHRSYESNAPVRFYWYDDRIEIQNPGGLYGMASPENFPRQTDYRNPVIAEAMATLGYVNAYGRGVIRSQDALAKNGNPPADFVKNELTQFLATIRRKP
jgi:ATP-dependent DNA helicase RecG